VIAPKFVVQVESVCLELMAAGPVVSSVSPSIVKMFVEKIFVCREETLRETHFSKAVYSLALVLQQEIQATTVPVMQEIPVRRAQIVWVRSKGVQPSASLAAKVRVQPAPHLPTEVRWYVASSPYRVVSQITALLYALSLRWAPRASALRAAAARRLTNRPASACPEARC